MIAPQLISLPLAGLTPIGIDDANRLLVDQWQHKLGACERPFRQEAYALFVDDRPVGVVISASTVSDTVAGERDGQRVEWRRDEVVELARLAGEPWCSRVLIRLWREVCAQRWDCWPVKAAVSYSHNAMHRGDLYRFDGWTRIRSDAGKSSGGGTWSRKTAARRYRSARPFSRAQRK